MSLSITALIGIVTILTGTGGDLQSKIMVSTLVIGLFSVLSLCDLTVFGRPFQVTGFVGMVAAAVALAVSLLMIWKDWGYSDADNNLWKTLWVATIVAASLAHANLMIPLVANRRLSIRVGLMTEFGLIALLAILLLLLIVSDGNISSDGYTRLVATVAILDVLGTIVMPVLARFLRNDADVATTVRLQLTVPSALADRLASLAAAQNSSPEQVALAAIDKGLGAK